MVRRFHCLHLSVILFTFKWFTLKHNNLYLSISKTNLVCFLANKNIHNREKNSSRINGKRSKTPFLPFFRSFCFQFRSFAYSYILLFSLLYISLFCYATLCNAMLHLGFATLFQAELCIVVLCFSMQCGYDSMLASLSFNFPCCTMQCHFCFPFIPVFFYVLFFPSFTPNPLLSLPLLTLTQFLFVFIQGPVNTASRRKRPPKNQPSAGPFQNTRLSSSAQTHTLKKLRSASKCRECDSYVYFNGAECEVCGLTCHKKCLGRLNIKCGTYNVRDVQIIWLFIG